MANLVKLLPFSTVKGSKVLFRISKSLLAYQNSLKIGIITKKCKVSYELTKNQQQLFFWFWCNLKILLSLAKQIRNILPTKKSFYLFASALVVGQLHFSVGAFAEHLDEVEARVQGLALVPAQSLHGVLVESVGGGDAARAAIGQHISGIGGARVRVAHRSVLKAVYVVSDAGVLALAAGAARVQLKNLVQFLLLLLGLIRKFVNQIRFVLNLVRSDNFVFLLTFFDHQAITCRINNYKKKISVNFKLRFFATIMAYFTA
ncbi:hypothetical protein BpHYR1_027523 [Brachionus plicatilis]|uniref:Uncharacterized protein n=1 Tax=Brachionus plicatilis TaxID=10195 RepID=A0A3M7SNK4_BRAPC|nr:hypothetical protein BpHYR1_027523 [Brachionus plicatilis]